MPVPGQDNDVRVVPAAQYVRMSTEHQRYSTENQADAIAQYAARQGFEVVWIYADHGKSGPRIQGRDALRQLLNDVQSGSADFRAILVYDVSRWGRFQDADESAYYEYICRRAGIEVRYCAEQFENDGSIASTIVKTVKRAMAGEYSRELSAKVLPGSPGSSSLDFARVGRQGTVCAAAFSTRAASQRRSSSAASAKACSTSASSWSPDPLRKSRLSGASSGC
jgi:resolvase-like protein